ncbi:MAG: prolyl oligopeptidase family serine peptidase [Candidatus Bipolaricaulia bacterium]
MQEFRPQDLYNLKVIKSLSLSPGGNKVVFGQREFEKNSSKPRTNLWLISMEADDPPTIKRLTRGQWEDSSPQWNNQETKLAFLSNRPYSIPVKGQEDRGERRSDSTDKKSTNEKDQIWILDLTDEMDEPRQLTNNSEGVSSFHWSPDGKRIVYSGRDPTPEQREYLRSKDPIVVNRLQHKYDGRGYLDNVRNHLFVIDLTTRERTRITCEDYDDRSPRWNPDGSGIAFISNRTGNPDNNKREDLWLIQPNGSNLRRLTRGEVDASRPRWSPSGEHIAYIGSNEPENPYRLDRLKLVSKEGGEQLTPTERFDYGCLGTSYPNWSVNGEYLYTVVGKEAQGRLIRSPAFSIGETEILFPGREEFVHLELFDFDSQSQTSTFTLSSPMKPRDVYIADKDDLLTGRIENSRQMTTLNQEWLENRESYQTERFVVRGANEDEIEFLVNLPAHFSGDPAPAILWIHGGPMTFDSPSFDLYSAVFATLGYVVLHVNYHGSSSYGEDFTMSVRGDWGRREEEDFKASLNYLMDKGWIDPEKLFVGGASMGGILTNWLLGRTDLFRAAVSERSECDYFSAFGTDDMHIHFTDDLGLPWEHPEDYRDISPIRYVANMETPVLFIEGAEDYRCSLSNTEQLYVSLKKRGVESELVIYPGESHVFEEPYHRVDRLERTLDWFAEHGGITPSKVANSKDN